MKAERFKDMMSGFKEAAKYRRGQEARVRVLRFSTARVVLKPKEIRHLVVQPDRNFLNSTLREKIVEHLFVGELLRQLWRRGVLDVEVLRSEFDSSGYDVAISQGDIIRHVQLKTTTRDAKRRSVGVHRSLAEKPSGCVLWICVDNDLNLGPFYWFGSALGERLPSLDGCRPSKRPTANTQGIKPKRSRHVELKRSRFTRLENIAEVVDRLFDPRLEAHKRDTRPGAKRAGMQT